ncbi:FtsQ-type POTRA domain-containing protein [Wenzhouxiangella sp. XN79A]|uniref:cell division protein FtsQ/DivIB n=1 Tax=Wenzhouxiangella sp. XN79A TaxID=2724193 RepID=UPI00144A8ECC|nr:cell division protein FtsQ/DivIB [Wenzhouxiangella sp. XN79A]NKI34325.1 FtsQ-type POTRA domain-containing protein [Wenzhouxiangella sp. XN79A]
MNRGLWMLMTPAALAVLAAAVWLFGGWQDPDRWPIRWLDVEGQLERTTAAQVRAAVAAEARRGFFVINVERARRSVEDLPWVAAASVSREWPDALTVEVREHQPVARWNDRALVSREGEVFDVAGTSGMQGLVQLRGPDARRAEVFDTWQALDRRMRSFGVEIARVELNPRGAWMLVLDTGWELLLGREQLESRVDRFLAVQDRLAEVPGVRRVDLRYPNGLALSRSAPPINELAARDESVRRPDPHRDGDHG